MDNNNLYYKNFAKVGREALKTLLVNLESAKNTLNNIKNISEANPEEKILEEKAYRTSAAAILGAGCESALKALLFSTEFIKMNCYTHIDGDNKSNYYPVMDTKSGSAWRTLLDSKPNKELKQMGFTDARFGIIKNATRLFEEIKKNAFDGDPRKSSNYKLQKDDDMNNNRGFNQNTFVSGHDLYAYLRLQSPEIQLLVNNGLFLLGQKSDIDEKIIGVLEGFYTNLPGLDQSDIEKNSRVFETKRFSWLTGEDISNDDLKSLIDFSTVLCDISNYKFPDFELLEKICNEDYSVFENTPISDLDPVSKYYAKKYFVKEEDNNFNHELNNILEVIKENNLNKSDAISYLNTCIFYKYYIKEKLKVKSDELNFDKKYAQNMYTYSSMLKGYDAEYDTKLEEDPIFISNMEKIIDKKVGIVLDDNIGYYDIGLGDEIVKEALSYELADNIHEEWRKIRDYNNGKFEPKIKVTKDTNWIAMHQTNQVDIANCSFEELPSDWQSENLEAAKVVINELYDDVLDGEVKTGKIHNVCEKIHDSWKQRHPSIYDPVKGDSELTASYDDLSIENKHRCLTQIMPAIDLIQDYKNGLINIEEICKNWNIEMTPDDEVKTL